MYIPSIASHLSPGRCVLLKGRPRQCHEHAELPVRCLSMVVTMEQRPRRSSCTTDASPSKTVGPPGEGDQQTSACRDPEGRARPLQLGVPRKAAWLDLGGQVA